MRPPSLNGTTKCSRKLAKHAKWEKCKTKNYSSAKDARTCKTCKTCLFFFLFFLFPFNMQNMQKRRLEPSKFIRICTCPAEQKCQFTSNCGAFSLRQNSNYSYVSPEPIRFYLRKRRQPETVQNSKPPLVRHVTVTSVGIKLKTQRGYRHRTCDTWRGEK